MRTVFAKTLLELAKKDSRIMLLTGDLGYSVFEPFEEVLPKQFLNCGIAEQNMMGVASGLAIEGFIPVVYSIVPFATMRCFEQIRNDICYQNLNVKIVGVGAGFSYGALGYTHYGIEDVGILRMLPNLTIIAPGDPVETKLASRAMMVHYGPVYLRLGKAGEPVIHKNLTSLRIGRGILVNDGSDVTVIATSTMVDNSFKAVGILEKLGMSVRFISMPTIQPIDTALILSSARKTKYIVTVEEHNVNGGLGSAICEILSDKNQTVPLLRLGVTGALSHGYGRQEFMREKNGLTPDKIARRIKTWLSI
jgi:transketolase